MSKIIKCPRCHGPAAMVDKAPHGESGDVIRCQVETECTALTEAAKEVERCQAAAADGAAEFVRAIGRANARPVGDFVAPPAEIKVPGYLYLDLQETVREWKDAGQALYETTVAFAAAQRSAAA